MQLGNNFVPESGQREFDYSESELSATGWNSVLLGSIIAVLLLAVMVGFVTGFVRGGSLFGWVGTMLFFCAGTAIVCVGISYLLAAKNEKIILTPTQVVWIDRFGHERCRCLFTQVRHAEEALLSQASTNRRYSQAPMHHRCILMTDAGRIVFSDGITDYDRLKDFFLSIQTVKVEEGVFNYRSKVAFVLAAIVLPITGLMSAFAIKMYVNGDQMTVNHVLQKTPLTAPLFACTISSVFWVVIGRGMLSSLFERIVVSSERVKWVGIYGNVKTDVPLTLIERGSFAKAPSYVMKNGFNYWVVSPKGKVRWSDAISGCSDLIRIMQKTSNESPLGAVPEPDPLEPQTGRFPR